MQVDINTILEDLKSGKASRTQDSLDKLNALLEARFNAGERDYSIAAIGRVSKAEGGVGTVSIRNKTGEHFRLLINAWATKANTTMKKPPVPQSRKLDTPSDMELLKRLDDPAMRAVFGQIIAEKNKLKAENRILKQNAEVVVDMRPNRVIHAEQVHQEVELLPSLDVCSCRQISKLWRMLLTKTEWHSAVGWYLNMEQLRMSMGDLCLRMGSYWQYRKSWQRYNLHFLR